ncbi:hypothetical protein FB645_005402 [Coemansia sp. IMI 203386]|nr:hypothetical protein FB645_005402 [Coemansia sp. IMI 203386]
MSQLPQSQNQAYPHTYSFHGMNQVNKMDGVPDIASVPTVGGQPSAAPPNSGTPAPKPMNMPQPRIDDNASYISLDTGTTAIPAGKGPGQGGPYAPGGFPQNNQQRPSGPPPATPYQGGQQPNNQQYGNGGWQSNPYAGSGYNSHAGPLRPQPGSDMGDYESYVAAANGQRPGTAYPGQRPPMQQPMRPQQGQQPPYQGPPQGAQQGRPPMPPQGPPPQNQQSQPPQQQPLRPALRPPSHHPGNRPPPNHHAEYSSDSSSSIGQPYGHHANHGNQHGKHRPNQEPKKFSFLNCLKDSLKHVEYMELLPIAGVLGASLFHHYKHRGSKHVVPFREPTWVKYLNNIAFAHNAYGMVKHGAHGAGGGGSGGGIPWTGILSALAGSAMASGVRPGGHGNNSQAFGRPPPNRPGMGSGFQQPYGRPNGQHGGGFGGSGGFGGGGSGGGLGGDMVTKVLGKVLGNLFKGGMGGNGGRTRDLESSNYDNEPLDIFSTFDDTYALQKVVAEHYYKHVFHKNMDLRTASAQTLGGAAAMRVLRREGEINQQFTESREQLPEDMTPDQMLMGCVMSEVEELLRLKEERGPLDPEDTLENVGTIALATIIKIKLDEERGLADRKSQSANEDGYSSTEQHNGHDHVRRNQSTRHGHREHSRHHHDSSGSQKEYHGQRMGENKSYDNDYNYNYSYGNQYNSQSTVNGGFSNNYSYVADPYKY